MYKILKRFIIIIFLLVLLILYLINSSLIIKSILDYTTLFITKLFPVNFLFFTISSLLIDYGLIELISTYLKLNTSSFYIFFMSIISGFPSGSKYTKELLEKNICSIKNSNKLIMSSHFPNPLFILGPVSIILRSKTLAFKIYLSLFISNFLIFIFTNPKDKKISFTYKEPSNFSTSLSNSINKTLKVIILIYGSSIFFYLISVIINRYLILNTNLYIIVNGLFDLTKGISSLSLCNNTLLKSILACFFLSFGGISIHMQVKSIISNTPIKYSNFLLGRIISTIISLLILILIY